MWRCALVRSRPLSINLDQTPPEPDPARLPRVATRKQLALIHNHYFGPLSERTIEVAPLAYRLINGVAVYSVGEFLAWAAARFEASPKFMGRRGSRRRPSG